MKVYRGSFKKKNGEIREMTFAKIQDIPESFISERIAGTGSERVYPPGMELVWCLEDDVNNFRIFNHNTKVGNLQVFEIKESEFIDRNI